MRSAILGVFLSCWLFWGCSSEETAPISPTTTTSVGVGGSGGSGAGGSAPLGPIVIDATEASIALDFDIAIDGAGTSFVGGVAVASATGTIEVGGQALPLVAYERQPFGSFVLYQMLAVAPDRWYVVWAYCLGTDLAWLYYEGTDGTRLAVEPASGSCSEGPGPVVAEVRFPALDMPLPPLIGGFTLEGPDVSLDGANPGSVTLGALHSVLAFEHVDCTTQCGSPGWREIHAILWDEAARRACFGIFYLFDDDPNILLAYALTLPDLSDPAGDLVLPASWSYAPR